MNATSPRTKCQNAAFRLQHEAYLLQAKKSKVRHFKPCSRGLIYSAELAKEQIRPLSLLWLEVSLTHCVCHQGFSQNDCMDYEMDPTYNPYTKDQNENN
jgi:hypothetical protein